jgi:glycosyltransferase involved in cell wall biosynthesis
MLKNESVSAAVRNINSSSGGVISINYISNLDIRQDGGGWDGMNKNVYQQLQKFARVQLVDAINPGVSVLERVVSKIKRNTGLKAGFPAFSTKRLGSIAALVEKRIKTDVNLNFFHGSTPWIMVENKVPYACYLDASFATYLSVYHKGSTFDAKPIMDLERKFLKDAKAVFFSSKWSLEQTRSTYTLPGENFYVAGLGGNLPYRSISPAPEKKRFVFVGLDFHGKGGDIVAEAFKLFSASAPGFCMTFVGAAPPPAVLEIPGVEYVGYLDKRKETDLRKYQEILSGSVALVLPTSRDMTPLVIIEAGYFGCPAIATNAYGIPEIIGDHGYLCSIPVSVRELVKAMVVLKEGKNDPEEIKRFYNKNFTWEAAGAIMRSVLCLK